ncbi:unnamed protein product [Closterium sp. Naga37s-1]|nr:unnamed protein product [Closterium sp. Naga37s-1]
MSVPASAECHLLPGLPHDLALACLARLSLWDLPAARCVSRAWAAAIRRQSFGRLRRRVRAERGGWTVAGRGERLCRRTSADLKAFPRWRRLPPLPPTNPHAHPACYGAAATVIPGTGFAIVGGAVPSQSGRPQHVRHVSVFDWHMGAWFAVQQPCMLPRLDPVVAAMGATSEGRTCGSIQKACAGRSNLGWRNCLVVVGGCPVPFFPRGSSAGSCGRVAVRPSEGRVVEHHPASSPPGASPSSHVRHPFLGVCTMCIAMPADGFGADECDNDERASNSRSESIHSSDSSSGGGGGSRAVTSSMLSGCSLTDGGSIREQYYQFPRLDSLVLGGRVFVRRHVSPYFAVNPGGFNRHAHRPAPPAHTTHGPGNRVTGTGGRAGGGSMVSEAGVVEVDWGSAEMWRVVEESDVIHAIWTKTHVAQVIVADVTEADTGLAWGILFHSTLLHTYAILHTYATPPTNYMV